VIPAGWLVLDLGAEDIEQAMQAAAELNPDLAPFIGSYGDMAAQGMRLMAMEMDAQAVAAGYVTNAVLIALEGMGDMGLTLDFLVESTALSLEGMFAGAELLSYEMIEDPNGLPLGRIDLQMPLTTVAGDTATVRSIWIMAISHGQLVELTLQAESGLFAESEAQLEQIVESFELLGE
jgi:hypothetical protein